VKRLKFEEVQAKAAEKGLQLTRLLTARKRWRFYLSRGDKHSASTNSLEHVDRMIWAAYSDDELLQKLCAAGARATPDSQGNVHILVRQQTLIDFLRKLHGGA